VGAQIIDNNRVRLADVINEIAPSFTELSIATGYWDLLGLQTIIANIRTYKSIRLLIGQEPLPPSYAKALDINRLDETFPESQFVASLEALEHRNELRELVIEVKKLVSEERLKVKVYRGNFLHAKTYIFGSYKSKEAIGIIGSSNFTQAGLTENIELNALEDESRIVKFVPQVQSDQNGHLSWFESIWNDEKSEVWDGTFTQILENSPVGDIVYSPYHMYIRALYEVYGEELVPENEYTGSASNVLYEFQKRNASLLINKLRRNGLAMLADSVGLGKTITAGEVIRYYIEEQDAKRIYVVAPANLTEQWQNDLLNVHKMYDGYKIISMQDIGRIQKERQFDEYKTVDLFVVDEAHNLRSGSGTRHDELLDWFSDNPNSHVLLLTATPINNSLRDFVNQIQLAAKGKLESFPVVYPTATKTETLDFFQAVERLISDANKAEKKGEKPDYAKANNIMRQGLSRFLVRTTRQGIEREFGGIQTSDGEMKKFPKSVVRSAPYKYEPALMQEIRTVLSQNVQVFGKINPIELSVESLLAQTQRTKHPLDQLDEVVRKDSEKSNPFESIFQGLLLLGFVPYKSDIYKIRYYGKTPEEIKSFNLNPDESFRLNSQLSVHNMLRVTLLKRLESSQYALKKSLENYLAKIKDFKLALDVGYIVRLKDLRELRAVYGDDLESFDDVDLSQELDDRRVEADPKVFNLEALKGDLLRDERIIGVLLKLCDTLNRHDDKLIAFANLVKSIVGNKKGSNKLLVFTYFADTIEYLKQNLPSLLPDIDFALDSAFTSGANKRELEQLARRFSPKSKGAKDVTSESEIHYLFSTDVLSEGQNLQDCSTLVNFDLHWNPVRMIQRNGRVNRLGSTFSEVFIYNMRPDVNLDEYLALVDRLERKIERISSTIGTDSSILGELENPIEYISDLYDDTKATAAFAALDDDKDLLSEDEFIRDLRQFEKEATNEEKRLVDKIPNGKWGYLPAQSVVPKNLQALGLIKVSGSSGLEGTKFENSIFVSVTDTLQPMETMEALHLIRASADAKSRRVDQINLDRPTIQSRARKIAEKHSRTTPTHFKVTASPAKVLDKLFEVVPTLAVRAALNRIRSKSELRIANRLFRQAARELKNSHLQTETLDDFRVFTSKLESMPMPTKTPELTSGVLYFAR
jgi:superfamily II DNA or RNA helicase